MNTNSNNLQGDAHGETEALALWNGTVQGRNNVEDGLSSVKNCFQDSADNPSTLADCSTLSEESQPT